MVHPEYLALVRRDAGNVRRALDLGVVSLWSAVVADLVAEALALAAEVERLGRFEQALAALARGRTPAMAADEFAGTILAGAQVSQARPSQTGEGDG